MTHPDETPRDGDAARRDRAASSSDSSPVPDDPADPVVPTPLDEDAAWRAIVENYGARPDLGSPRSPAPTDPVDPAGPADPAALDPRSEEPPAAAAVGPSAFDRSYLDSLQDDRDAGAARWHDEGHFVPPEPPAVPRATPARRLAWIGLFLSPTLMLLAVVLGWSYPQWFSLLLVASFVGGFVFLVATMDRRHDDWSGDDGAVV